MIVIDDAERVIDLCSTVGTALILNFPSGVKYENQVGGAACLQRVAEGVLIPFENDYGTDGKFISLEMDLAAYFEEAWGASGATSGIEIKDADAIEDMLRRWNLNNWFCVDRTQLLSSVESWIHVTVLKDASYCRGFGPYPQPGILTWSNSD
jgi:hypothetical protein